jgi:hypothetical protein
MQWLATLMLVHAVKKMEHICETASEGLTHWVPNQVDGNTLGNGDPVYGSCEEDLYYEI